VMTRWAANVTLAISITLYAATLRYDLHLTTYPNGFWSFNPFAWQLLFVLGAWCALGGARRLQRFLSSPVTLSISFVYLLAAFCITLTWYFPQLKYLMPQRLELWIYPIDKTDLDVLRFGHFLALAVIAVRFVPSGWPGLQSRWAWPMILCGQNSLEIFCFGVVLSFTGYFLLTEISASLPLHLLVGLCGILMMSAAAWVLSWYKVNIDKRSSRTKDIGSNVDAFRTWP